MVRRTHLLIELYRERHGDRAREYAACLAANLVNPFIDEVHVVHSGVPLPAHPKLASHIIPERATFDDLLRIAQQSSRDGDVVVLANADVIFDGSAEQLSRIEPAEAYALTRYEPDGWGDWHIRNGSDSQDAWVLRRPWPPIHAEFHLGVPGCDNRFAKLLADAGLRVLNPSLTIRLLHNHLSEVRNYTRAQQVMGEYMHCPLERLPQAGAVRSLHIGLPNPALARALDAVGPSYFVDWAGFRRRSGVGPLRDAIRQVCAEHRPDFIFAQLQTPDMLDLDTVKAFGCPSINWTGDVRDPLPDWYAELAEGFTVTAFTNTRDVETLRQRGLRAAYLQIGFDDQIYHPAGPKLAGPEIVFMGRDYGDRFPLSRFRSKIVAGLQARYGSRFGVYGSYPGAVADLAHEPHSEAAVYRNARIGINISHFCLPRYSSDRIFRIMGCGAFCVSPAFPDSDIEFSDYEYYREFFDIEDLFKIVDFYLDNEDSRPKIALAGCRHVHATATWPVRVQEIRRLLNV